MHARRLAVSSGAVARRTAPETRASPLYAPLAKAEASAADIGPNGRPVAADTTTGSPDAGFKVQAAPRGVV